MHNILSGQGKNPAKRQTNAEQSVQLKCLVIPELLLFRCSPTPWSINGGKEKKIKSGLLLSLLHNLFPRCTNFARLHSRTCLFSLA